MLTKLAGGTVATLEVMVVLRLLHIVCVLDTATIVAFELVRGQVGRHRWRFKRKGDARKGTTVPDGELCALSPRF